MTKTRKALFAVAIILGSMFPMSDLLLVPVLNNLFVDFAESPMVVNFIVSGATLTMLISSLLVGRLARFVSKKLLMIIGGTITTVCALFMYTIYDASIIAILHTFIGFGWGTLMVCSYSLITEIFPESKESSRMIGFYNAGMSIFGMILSLVGGIVAVNVPDWRSITLVYLIFIPILIMFILFIPDTGKESSTSGTETGVRDQNSPKSYVWLLVFNAIIMGVIANVFLYYISSLMAESQIGNEAFTGSLTSVYTGVSFVVSIAFGIIYGKAKGKTNAISFVLAVLGFTLLFAIRNVPAAIVASGLIGGGYGLALSYLPTRAAGVSAPSKASTVMGLINAGFGAGTFLATYIVSLLLSAMATDSYYAVLPAIAVLGTVALLVEFVMIAMSKKKGLDSISESAEA